MDTTAESRGAGNVAARILLRIFLVLCGIGLFVAAGIGGGLLALNWLV
ncbi:MAG TPA: hypothetical protein VFL78_01260 [Rhodanobacteraceae bacterium]|nr:hypothetical protein [Rhodanobacteraceae bacterium]